MPTLRPPATVARAFARGVTLFDAGYGGAGLRPATVAWARRLANRDLVDLDKVRLMRAWFARHGPSVAEGLARVRDPRSHAAVAWLLWGGTPSIPWERRHEDPVFTWLAALGTPTAGRTRPRGRDTLSRVNRRVRSAP